MNPARFSRSALNATLRSSAARPTSTPFLVTPAPAASSYHNPSPNFLSPLLHSHQHARFPTSFVRSFSSSSTSLAAEAPHSPFEPPEVSLFDRLQTHPEVFQAIQRMTALAKEKTGVDLAAGEKPTLAMMKQLATDKDLMSVAQELIRALNNAGINIDPLQAFKALKSMGGEGFDKLKDLDSMESIIGGGKKNGDGESDR